MDPKQCKCCGGTPTQGLFERNPVAPMPESIRLMQEADQIDGEGVHDEQILIRSQERFFLRADLPLPLRRHNTPILPRIWLEISPDDVEGVEVALISEEADPFAGAATIGCDLPGFPGMVGARTGFVVSGPFPARITSVSDRRLQAIPTGLDHENMAMLYRAVWGNWGPVPEADMSLRYRLREEFSDLFGRPSYRKQITPPPSVAGIRPTELLIAPPLDTGGEAIMATIGCSETSSGECDPVEIICYARNPTDKLIDCIGEFGYLSRLVARPISEGTVIPERRPIPDSQERLVAWLLCSPWWIESKNWREPIVEGQKINLLAAVPLHHSELGLASSRGPDALIQEFEAEDIDPADFSRDPVV